MSRRSRNKKTRNSNRQQTAPTPTVGYRSKRWLAGTITILCVGIIAIGIYAVRQNSADPIALPPLAVSVDALGRAPVIDASALARFTQQYQLPEVPDLTRVSVEAARDIYGALEDLAARPDDAASFGQLGRVFQSHKYPAKALECYSRAETLAPTAHDWPYYIGRLHADAYDFGPAIAAYERAAALKPNYAPTFFALGNLYLQSGDVSKARIAFQTLVTLRPQSSHGYLGLAQIASDEQEYDAAVELLNDAISRDSKDFRAHSLLGQAYQQLDQPEQARQHLAMVNSLNRRDQRSKQIVFDDPLYHRMLASNTTDAALTKRLQAALGTNQLEVAIRLATELSRRHPDDAERMHSLAVACKQAKRYRIAFEHVEQAIRLDADLLAAQVTKAQLLLILRRHDEALNLLDRIVAQDPDSFDGHYNRGAAQVLSEQYESAIQSFQQAIRLHEDSARAHVALAEALSETNRIGEATKQYRRALELDPTSARAKQRLRELQE